MASTRGIEAARAFVRTDADLSPLDKKLKLIEAKFKQLGQRISSIGSGLARAGAGVSAIGASILAPITAAVKQFTSAGDALDKMSARTGVSVEALSELGFAAEQGGSNIGAVEKGLAGLARTLFDASNGSSSAAEGLAAIGLSARQLRGLRPEDQFQAVADALSQVRSESRKGAIAQRIFGRGGRELLPMLSTLREVRQEARDLGLVLSRDDTTAAAKLSDAFNRIKRTIGGAFLQVGAAVAEPVLRALKAITQITATVNKWVAANRELVQQIAVIGLGISAAGVAMTTLGIAVIGLGATIASIGTIASAAFAAVGSAISIATSPITLAVAGIAAIGYVALEASGSLTVLSKMFGDLGTTATTAWAGIVAAISSGDLQTAGQIAFTALEVAWQTVTTKLREVWSNVADFFVNTWLAAVESIVQVGANIYFGIAKYFDQLTTALTNGFDTAGVYIIGVIDSIQTAIAQAIVKALEFTRILSKSDAAAASGILSTDAAGRAAAREAGLGQRAGDRAAGLSQRDSQRRQDAQQFAEIVGDDFRRRQSPVDRSGLSDAQKRLEELKAKLAQQASEAQQKAAKAQTESVAAQRFNSARLGADGALSSAGSVGTFVAGVAGRIAGGGVQDDLTNAAKETAENTGALLDQFRLMVNGGGLA